MTSRILTSAWPEFLIDPKFLIDGDWVDASELFGPVGSLSRSTGFSNADGETLFDALARTSVDWDGTTSSPGTCSACDLSATVLEDFGRFDSRDELFAGTARRSVGPRAGWADRFWDAGRPGRSRRPRDGRH